MEAARSGVPSVDHEQFRFVDLSPFLLACVLTSLIACGACGVASTGPSAPPTESTRPAASLSPFVLVGGPAADAPVVDPTGGDVAVSDTTGQPVPPEVVTGAREIARALSANDLEALRARYAPAPGVASWTVASARLASPTNRAGLVGALAKAPEPRPEVAYLFSDGPYGVGMTLDGRIAFFGVGQ